MKALRVQSGPIPRNSNTLNVYHWFVHFDTIIIIKELWRSTEACTLYSLGVHSGPFFLNTYLILFDGHRSKSLRCHDSNVSFFPFRISSLPLQQLIHISLPFIPLHQHDRPLVLFSTPNYIIDQTQHENTNKHDNSPIE